MVDLNDQIWSIRRFIFNLYPGHKVFTSRIAQVESNKPLWRIERVNHRVEQTTTGWYTDSCQWILTYVSGDRKDVDLTISKLVERIQGTAPNSQRRVIPMYKFGWQPPQPSLQAVQDSSGMVPPGTYDVQVSLIDQDGTESAASVPVELQVQQPNNAIRVEIPLSSYGGPIATDYCAYVNDNRVAIFKRNNLYYPSIVIKNIGVGAPPIAVSEQLAILWRYMRIVNLDSRLDEDEYLDNLFMGIVTLETDVTRELVPAYKPLMSSVTITEFMVD